MTVGRTGMTKVGVARGWKKNVILPDINLDIENSNIPKYETINKPVIQIPKINTLIFN